MPYVKQSDRRRLDPLIEALSRELSGCLSEQDYESFGGELNYVITKLAKDFIMSTGGPRYATLSLAKSAMVDAADEFTRTEVVPYENLKREWNGDVKGTDYQETP